MIESGSGTILRDLDGTEYVDCFSGIAVTNTGHSPERLVNAATNQMRKLIHASGLFYTIPQSDLVKKIAEIAPGKLKYTFLCNSGAEAVDNAVKIVKKYASKNGKPGAGLISLEMSFHGRLGYSLSLTGQRKYKNGFSTYANSFGVVHAPVPYAYRSKLDEDEFGEETAKAVERTIETHTPGDIAAFIMEPILGEGGIIVPPDSYFKTLLQILKEREIPLIIDEVQTGFGRTGKLFGSNHWNLEPDVMTMAKGMGGGMPIGAAMATPEIASSIDSGDFFSTYGGNPVCSAVALENIKMIEEENLVQNSANIGKIFMEELESLQNRFPVIGDIRGRGLMIGVELVKDRTAKTPDPESTNKIVLDLRKNGVIMGSGGFYKNVLRIQPPLVITEEQATQVISKLTKSFEGL
ncbi:MAG: aspartate aminotransferase family protein [Candidatus Heimdallarchaeota archaeon]|nr:aspartate aminotransferase family protein [Candidatus Heimdallarchaeota archaeon]